MAPSKFTRDSIEALQDESIIAAFDAIFYANWKCWQTGWTSLKLKISHWKRRYSNRRWSWRRPVKKIIALEAYNRKENLIITGLPIEYYSEATSSATLEAVTTLSVTHVRDTEQAVLKLCQDCLNIDITTHDISTANRLKVKQGVNGVGSVIVRFTNLKARDLVYGARLQLKGAASHRKVFIHEDLPQETVILFRMQGRCARRKSSTVHELVAVRSSFDDLATRITSRRKCGMRVTFVILLFDDRTWTDFRTGLSDFLIRDLDICFCVEFFVLPLWSIYCACCGENVSMNSYHGATYY